MHSVIFNNKYWVLILIWDYINPSTTKDKLSPSILHPLLLIIFEIYNATPITTLLRAGNTATVELSIRLTCRVNTSRYKTPTY